MALGLAEALAGDGCLLVDADTYGGTVAPMIGMLDEAPGIAAACRAAATGRLDRVALGAMTPVVVPGLRVLSGISRPERWPEVPDAHLEEVWAAARELDPWTVVDCGFALERDEALSYDTRAPQRNGATLSALAEADLVVVVGAADPIGLQRLVRGLMDLDDLGPTAARLVVVTKVRATVAGSRPGRGGAWGVVALCRGDRRAPAAVGPRPPATPRCSPAGCRRAGRGSRCTAGWSISPVRCVPRPAGRGTLSPCASTCLRP